MSLVSTDISQAPKDRNILIRTQTFGFSNQHGWMMTGHKWVEARWYEPDHEDGQGPRFVEWCGNSRTHTTGSLHPVAWCELPDGIGGNRL